MALWDGFTSSTDSNSFGVIVMGATNRPGDVDAAFLRRMPRTFEVKLPGAPQREQILKVHLRDEPLVDLNVSQLARETEGYSGSDLKELCRAALMIPLREYIEMCKEKSNEEELSSSAHTKLERRRLSYKDFQLAKEQVLPTGASAYAYAASANQTNTPRQEITPEMLASIMAFGMQQFMQQALPLNQRH
jgi:SpoVK/Ycf46/Vps4 family AAA+-type ATPase